MSTYCQYRMGKRGPLGREAERSTSPCFFDASSRFNVLVHVPFKHPDAILGDFAMG
jgi:hypothetical protein